MKVGTDGVLLGAWANCNQAGKVLDVGTGSGLIALMICQRNTEAQVWAIDTDTDACSQAAFNVEQSPFSGRIFVENTPFQRCFFAKKFDLIVSNPPYFSNSLKAPDIQRTKARHNDELPFDILIAKSASILDENGKFALILPATHLADITGLATQNGLYITRLTWVKPTPNHAPRRVLMEFGFKNENREESELIIETARHQYSDEYIALTKAFYLKMK